jgi:hypothetical protein
MRAVVDCLAARATVRPVVYRRRDIGDRRARVSSSQV